MSIIDEIKPLASLINKIKDPEQRERAMDLLQRVLEMREDNAKIRERIADLKQEIGILNNEKETQGSPFGKNYLDSRTMDDGEYEYDNSIEEKDDPDVFGHGPLELSTTDAENN